MSRTTNFVLRTEIQKLLQPASLTNT